MVYLMILSGVGVFDLSGSERLEEAHRHRVLKSRLP